MFDVPEGAIPARITLRGDQDGFAPRKNVLYYLVPAPPEFHVKVNGQDVNIKGKELSYENVVKLVVEGNWPGNRGPDHLYTVTYSWRDGKNQGVGSLVPGEKAALHEGMVFEADVTDSA